MTGTDDCASTLQHQPQLDLSKIKEDKGKTNAQEPIDSTLLELIQSVQHELRTPLHGMLALLSSLGSDIKSHIKDTENEQKLSDISSLGAQLLSVLDDFRDFASYATESKSAENQHHDLEAFEEADLSEILDDLAAEVWDHQVAAMKAEKGPDVRIPPPPELILTLDASLRSKQKLVSVDTFRKVAKKLIDNALKFTLGEGFVEISLAPHRVQVDEKDDIKHFLRLAVEDTGTGMTNDFISDDLFAPFAKADKFKSGAGLSMALCSTLVKKMGGSMQVSSDKSRGTTVIVLIPIESLPERNTDPAELPEGPKELVYFHGFNQIGLKRLVGSIASQLAIYGNLYATTRVKEADYILIPEELCYGEDNDDLEQLLAEAKDGVKVAVLQAHEDAKIELSVRKNGSPPPVFVTRKPFGPKSFARLIAFAKGGTPDIIAKNGSRRLSNEGIMGKPHADKQSHKQRFHTVDLVFTTSLSDEVLRRTPPATRLLSPIWEPQSGVAKPPRQFLALCVEDNPLNMRILTKVLSQCQVPFCMAVDGVEAVEQFEKLQPALVLLDINMPKMDGFEACKGMKKFQKHESYIIAITALSDDYSKKKGLQECGMDEWMSKPLDIVKFKNKIEALHEAFKGE